MNLLPLSIWAASGTSPVHASISRIKSLGTEMNDELVTQKRMINDLESQVDTASDAMASLKDKMKERAKHKDRGKFCTIMVLTVVLILLMYAVIS